VLVRSAVPAVPAAALQRPDARVRAILSSLFISSLRGWRLWPRAGRLPSSPAITLLRINSGHLLLLPRIAAIAKSVSAAVVLDQVAEQYEHVNPPMPAGVHSGSAYCTGVCKPANEAHMAQAEGNMIP